MWRFSALIAAGSVAATVFGARGASAQPGLTAEPETVVATVGDEAIFVRDVERVLSRVLREQAVDPEVLSLFQAQTLSEIVDRRLVLAYDRRTKSGPSEAEVDAAFAEFRAAIAAERRSLEAYLKEQAIAEADLRRQIIWNLTWEKYRKRYVTEERLASYFETHRREFDGTELSVSHILLQPADNDPRTIDELTRQARAIRREIISGKVSFAEAARKHSAGPSSKEGGRLGFIGRRGPMVESFSRAAFALEAGQVSEPVATRFGVHLIRCDEIKPGSRSLQDAREELEQALARELLEKLARLEARYTPVEFTGKSPYFKPGTRELVVP